MRNAILATLVLLSSGAVPAAFAQSPVTTPASAVGAVPNDYAKPENWLCRPGRLDDACAVDLTTTVVGADGSLATEAWRPDANAPVDCFYVYPTVSTDAMPNSDMLPGIEERDVVAQQFARFGAACRLYAPMYRQVTVSTLMANLGGRPSPANRLLPYNDVRDAWLHYLQHDNQGRGVVLIGHSQGSQVLTQLLIAEIDGKPVQKQLVAALLLGWNVLVPTGQDTGGVFKSIPVCRSDSQTGCVVSYVSFRSTVLPPPDAIFGRVTTPGRQASCTNPAAMAGGRGELRAYFRTQPRAAAGRSRNWVTPPRPIATPFVTLPGLLAGECVTDERGTCLSITVRSNPTDPRTDEIPGDMIVDGQVQPRWGLHLADVNLALGNLVDVVKTQAQAYQRGEKK